MIGLLIKVALVAVGFGLGRVKNPKKLAAAKAAAEALEAKITSAVGPVVVADVLAIVNKVKSL